MVVVDPDIAPPMVRFGKSSFLGWPQNRPIGMRSAGDNWAFYPKMVILTAQTALLASQRFPPGGTSKLRVPGSDGITYDDHDDLRGQYTCYLDIEAKMEPAECGLMRRQWYRHDARIRELKTRKSQLTPPDEHAGEIAEIDREISFSSGEMKSIESRGRVIGCVFSPFVGP
jgi:hypothetical protein